jgi:hypothetical protein
MRRGYKLIPGLENIGTVSLLIKMCNIKSETKKLALIEHFVNGMPQSRCAIRFKIGQSTIADAVGRLNDRHADALQYHELYTAR